MKEEHNTLLWKKIIKIKQNILTKTAQEKLNIKKKSYEKIIECFFNSTNKTLFKYRQIAKHICMLLQIGIYKLVIHVFVKL